MKHALLLGVSLGALATVAHAQSLNMSGLRQTFSDEFNSLSASPGGSASQWATTAFGIRTLPANGEQEFYSDSTVGVNPFSTSNGVLTIAAAPGSNPMGLPYNSGEISSQALHSQTYGIFEMRAQLPSGQGMWPAFWLMPTNGGPGEIDILEAFGAAKNGQGGANSYSVALHDTIGGGQQWINVPNTQSGMHTYGVDWQADTITWYFDGQPVKSMPTPANMHQPYYMIANLAAGGDWPGKVDGSTGQMKIDYIRAYAGNGVTPSVNLQSPASQAAAVSAPVAAPSPATPSPALPPEQALSSGPTICDSSHIAATRGDVIPTPTGPRDATQIPFASGSVFNRPLGLGATWQSNQQITGAPIQVNAAGNWNEPIYTGTASDPLVTVTNTAASGGTPATYQIHIPNGAVPAAGGDRTFTVADSASGQWFGMGGFHWTGSNTATVSQASAEPITGSGMTVANSNWNQGVGTLRASDLAAGVIAHMLRIEIPSSMAMSWSKSTTDSVAPFAWPQTVEDGFALNGNGGVPYTGTIPYGVTIGIPADAVEPPEVKANPGADLLWHALHEHGAMVRDTAGSSSAITIQTDQGVDVSNPLVQGMMQFGQKIMGQARILSNQGPDSINGGGPPIVSYNTPLPGEQGACTKDAANLLVASAPPPTPAVATQSISSGQTEQVPAAQPSIDDIARIAAAEADKVLATAPGVDDIARLASAAAPTTDGPSGDFTPPPPPATPSTPVSVSGDFSAMADTSGPHDISIAGSGNVISSTGGPQILTITGSGNSVRLGIYDDTVTLHSSGNTVDSGGGNDTVILDYATTMTARTQPVTLISAASGLATAGNTIVAPPAGQGVLTIQGKLAPADRIDLSRALAATRWNRLQGTMSQYVTIGTRGTATVISVSGKPVVRVIGTTIDIRPLLIAQ